MSTTSKSDLLRANAKRAIDVIVNDSEIDDDTKEEVLEDLQEHIEDSLRILSDEDGDDEDEDEGEEDEDEDGDE